MKKRNPVRIILTALILIVLAAMWGTESDITYNIAQQRAILLGRYTFEKTIGLLILTPALLLVVRALWKKKNPDPRARMLVCFKAVTLTLSILIALVFADTAMRLLAARRAGAYVGDATSYHRTPSQVFHNVFHDKPEFAFNYPNATHGYPPVEYTLTVDKNGFRNPVLHDQYDWIVLGDSFAEGSNVTDTDGWVLRLAALRGVRVYNLGMSGGSPLTYLDTLKKYGVELKPAVALYMLYEGNDFRDSNFRTEKVESVEVAGKTKQKQSLSDKIDSSPLRHLLKQNITKALEPIGKDRFNTPKVTNPEHRMYPVAWLPFREPAENNYGYTFDFKRLQQHYIIEDTFRNSLAGSESLRLLDEARRLCEENGIKLIVLYAPDKPHILFNSIRERVPAEQLHAFMNIRMKHLPEPEELVNTLAAGVNVHEQVFENYCAEHSVPFISLTEILSEQTRAGVRTYFTYDQHWTPEGHAVVADYLNTKIQN